MVGCGRIFLTSLFSSWCLVFLFVLLFLCCVSFLVLCCVSVLVLRCASWIEALFFSASCWAGWGHWRPHLASCAVKPQGDTSAPFGRLGLYVCFFRRLGLRILWPSCGQLLVYSVAVLVACPVAILWPQLVHLLGHVVAHLVAQPVLGDLVAQFQGHPVASFWLILLQVLWPVLWPSCCHMWSISWAMLWPILWPSLCWQIWLPNFVAILWPVDDQICHQSLRGKPKKIKISEGEPEQKKARKTL